MQNRKPTKEAVHKVGEYGLVNKFLGYRAREDNTMLPLGTLIAPSQNVLINTSGRVAHTRGYALDGVGSSAADSGILSNFDFLNLKGDRRNLRAGFLTSAGNDGKLQYRYVTGTSTVNWVDLKASLTNVRLSYTEYWDQTALVKNVLWVDGTNNVFSWNGAVTTLASATATTITKQGTNTWGQEGFAATGSVVIGGVTATYTGGALTTTLTGVSVDFSATIVGSIVHQAVVTTALSSMTGIPANFGPTVIGCGKANQVYLGASNSNNVYISKPSVFTDFSFTSPIRLYNEGALKVLPGPPVKFIPQESNLGIDTYDVYISYGQDSWAVVRITVQITSDSAGNQKGSEQLDLILLKTAPLQGAKSERLACKMKNNIAFVGNDNVVNFLGYTSYQFVPAIIDFSFPIIDDMNSYDLTDGSIFYHKNYMYVAIPKSGITRVYNMTDQTKQYSSYVRDFEDVTQQPWFWEAPLTFPLSGFYVVNGDLYGHSYVSSESYKLFTGGSLSGQNITAIATFCYDDKGDRTQSKGSDELWTEGYIKQNTILNATISGDLNSFTSSETVTINGSNNVFVAYGSGAHSLGTTSLGSATIGGATTSTNTLPAWFHVAKTYLQVPFYLESISYSTTGIDLDWQLLNFGTNATDTVEGNNDITD